jgi:stearoyl-CoA desaturase (delta-9 desaturase)
MLDVFGYILLSFLWWQFLSATAISAGYHRYFSHSAFKAPVWFEYFVLLFGSLAFTGPLLGWVWIHRTHHLHSDTDKDPHSPKYLGFWRTFFVLPGRRSHWQDQKLSRHHVKGLLKNKRVVFFYRNHKIIRMITFILGVLLLPVEWFLVLIVSPMIFGYLGFGLLNAVCHKRGIPNNTWWVSIFTAGEGWHKNHHDNTKRILNGTKWYHIDTGGYVSKLIGCL